MVLAVGKLARCLYGVVPLGTPEVRLVLNLGCSPRSTDQLRQACLSTYDGLAILLGHMSPYFPFAVHLSPLARRDMKVWTFAVRSIDAFIHQLFSD